MGGWRLGVNLMCGICGVIGVDRRKVEPAVRRMMRAMMHRGPDDEGYEELPLAHETFAGFGFRRLAIQDLSPAGHQPIFNSATGDCLIFNGEIYNYRQLRSRLQLEGNGFRSTGDSEVLLKALSFWGERALGELDGMHAFAFYEASSRRILLARDHLGIKPLYIAQTRDFIVFASEVRAVLSSGLVPFDLDPVGIAGFLAYGSPQDPHTIHSHIRSVPAGSLQWLDSDSLRTGLRQPTRYWSFPELTQGKLPNDVVDRMRERLERTVAEQCVADVQVGSFLSGGIDSAVLTGFAQRHCRDLRTFCVGYESKSSLDETAAAAQTAHALRVPHYRTVLDEDWMLLQWHQWLMTADRPSIDGLNTYIVSGAVKDGGATVALSGLGADELFGGYPQFWTIPRMYRWLAPFTWMPRPVRRLGAALAFAPLRKTRRERAFDMVVNCDSPVDLLLRMRRVFMNEDIAGLGLPAANLGLMENYLQPDIYATIAARSGDTFHQISHAESVLYMSNTLLRDSDANGMAHGLEIRVPFLGRRFVEETASLPGSIHAPAGMPPKHLLRAAASDLVPPDVFKRPKTGFSLPIGDWIFGKLREQCEAAIDAANACPILAPGSPRRLWNYFFENRNRLYWNRPLGLVVLGSYLNHVRQLSDRLASQQKST